MGAPGDPGGAEVRPPQLRHRACCGRESGVSGKWGLGTRPWSTVLSDVCLSVCIYVYLSCASAWLVKRACGQVSPGRILRSKGSPVRWRGRVVQRG